MIQCEQTPGMNVYQHGQMVADYYEDLRSHLETGSKLRYEWKLPEWISSPMLIDNQYEYSIMHVYQVFHDCGKPFCRIVDEDGRQHFPNHAEHSYQAWMSACPTENPVIGNLIRSDMDIHVLKSEDVLDFAKRPEACSLLMTGLAEIHANASMFGGIDSTSFKIKHRRLTQRGKAIVRELEAMS